MSDTPAPATPFPSNIEIAQRASMLPIVPLARERLGIPEESLEPYGRYKAKMSLDYVAQLADRPDGKLILVTAISPDAGRRGQDHHHRGARRCAQPARQEAPSSACASRRSGRCSA